MRPNKNGAKRPKSTKSEKPKPTKRRPPSRDEQRKEFRKFYAQSDDCVTFVIALLEDGANRFSFTSSADSLRDIATVKARFATEGLGFITKCLPSLFQCLLNYLETSVSSYPGFKTVKGASYPAFLQQYFAKIYDKSTSEADRALYVEFLYQVCVAFKKLKGPYRNSVLRAQLSEFVETDISLRYIDWDDADVKAICELMAQDIKVVLKDLDPELPSAQFLPRPGPGATNTPVKKHLRFRPHVLYTQLNDEFPYEEWFYSHPWDLVTEVYKHPFRLPVKEAPTSRFKFVPKTFSKARGICIEQLETQYLQQGLKNALYDRIENHPLTRGKVNFADQKINGELAKQSSRTKEKATIDQSEASNRVARELVKRGFKYIPEFRKKLMALSTRTIELPDEINFLKEFPVAMFAPMGSALCFPILALINFTMIRAICQLTGHQQHLDSIYVYGDDIICHSDVTEALFKYMPKFGMKLNVTKSYYKSYFRESCGVHAYYGREITPTYFKYVPTTNIDVQAFISLLQTEGQLYRKGYTETAKCVRAVLRKANRWGLTLPYVPPESFIPGFIRDEKDLLRSSDFSQCRRRWDSETQSFEYRLRVFSEKLEDLPCIQQDEGLLRWHLVGQKMEETVLKPFLDILDPVKVQAGVRGSLSRFITKTVWLRESALNGSPLRRELDRSLGVSV